MVKCPISPKGFLTLSRMSKGNEEGVIRSKGVEGLQGNKSSRSLKRGLDGIKDRRSVKDFSLS